MGHNTLMDGAAEPIAMHAHLLGWVLSLLLTAKRASRGSRWPQSTDSSQFAPEPCASSHTKFTSARWLHALLSSQYICWLFLLVKCQPGSAALFSSLVDRANACCCLAEGHNASSIAKGSASFSSYPPYTLPLCQREAGAAPSAQTCGGQSSSRSAALAGASLSYHASVLMMLGICLV